MVLMLDGYYTHVPRVSILEQCWENEGKLGGVNYGIERAICHSN